MSQIIWFYRGVGVVCGFILGILMVSIMSWLDYRKDCKQYGKEYADELRRRMI